MSVKPMQHVPKVEVFYRDEDCAIVVIQIGDREWGMNADHIPLNRRDWYASVLKRHVEEIDAAARKEVRDTYRAALSFMTLGTNPWPG